MDVSVVGFADEMEEPGRAPIGLPARDGEFETFELGEEARVVLAFLVGEVVADAANAAMADDLAAKLGAAARSTD